MVDAGRWDAAAAVAACPVVPWAREAWRFHNRRYEATDPGGSLRVTGRYHRGTDKYSLGECWPALYMGMQPQIAVAGRLRHTEPNQLPQLNNQRLSRLRVELGAVVDCCGVRACREPVVPGLTLDVLCEPFDYRVAHALAMAARARGVEGMVVPSCTRLGGGNLIVFTDRLRETSELVLVESEDPELYVERSQGSMS